MWGKASACWLVVWLTILSQVSNAAVSTQSYLNSHDKTNLKNVFISSLDSKDFSSIHYAVLGLKLLQAPIPKEQELCKVLLDSSKTAANLDASYFIASAWKSLQCKGTIVSAELTKKLDSAVAQDSSSLADIYYASQALNSLSQKISDPAKVVKNVKNALKKDDNLANLGYALHVAAVLGAEGAFMFDRIEDVIVQADEVDGKYLQFEGGLSTTALIVSGAYQLSQSLNKAPAISGEQAVKFANYFVSRRSVTTSKGAYNLLNVANIFSTNKHHIPVAISLHGSVAVSLEQPMVKVSVTNVLGNPLPNTLSVTVESVTNVQSNVVVASKLKATPVPNEKGVYSVNFLDKKPDPGSYRFSVSAAPTPADPKLVGNTATSVNVKVMCWLTPSDVSIGTVDTDRTTKPKLEPVSFPAKLPRALSADSQQRIIIQFTLKDKQTTKPTTVHQAFVRFTNKETKQEVILLTELGSDQVYKFDVDVGTKSAAFGHQSGEYIISLIVGDAVVSNSFVWDIATVDLRLSGETPEKAVTSKSMYYKPKPEIRHLFRQAESRPPVIVSTLFTGLVLSPILVLFVLWGILGINISNFPFKLSAIGFHLSLGGIFVLFGLFWLQLDMFDTLKYLFGLSLLTFWTGNSLLSHIASSKKH